MIPRVKVAGIEARTNSLECSRDTDGPADARRQQAYTDAQARVSSAQQQANQTTATAQAKLDDARRKKQNS